MLKTYFAGSLHGNLRKSDLKFGISSITTLDLRSFPDVLLTHFKDHIDAIYPYMLWCSARMFDTYEVYLSLIGTLLFMLPFIHISRTALKTIL